MCFGQRGMGECCETPVTPGWQDIYAYTTALTHQSSTRAFSRSCLNTTQYDSGNGREVETRWGFQRIGSDAQRFFLQSICPWGQAVVYQNEGFSHILLDEAFPVDLAGVNSRGNVYPIMAPTGDPWTIGYATTTQQLIYREIYETDVTAGARVVGYGGTGSFGIVFRVVDKDNYYLLRYAFSSRALTLERVIAGVSTILASVSGGQAGQPDSYGSMTLTTKLNQVSASFFDGKVNLSFSGAYVVAGTSTKCGFFKNTSATIGLSVLSIGGQKSRNGVTVYGTGDAHMVGTVFNDTPSATLYNYVGVPLMAGQAAYQHGKGNFGDNGGVKSVNGLDFATPVPSTGMTFFGGPTFVDPDAPYEFYALNSAEATIWGGGQEITSGAGRLAREELKFELSYWDSGRGLPVPTYWGTNHFVATQNALGKKVIGAPCKHGYPMSCGSIVEGVSRRTGPSLQNYQPGSGVPYLNLQTSTIYTVHFKAILGPLVWGGGLAPSTAERTIASRWDVDIFTFDQERGSPDGLTHTTYIPYEDEYAVLATITNSLFAQNRVPSGWDATPNLESWYLPSFGQGWKINDQGFDSTGRDWVSVTTYLNTHVTVTGIPAKLCVAGTVYDIVGFDVTNIVLGPTVVACVWTQGSTKKLKFYNGAEFTIGQNGLNDGAPFLMSDRFVYCKLTFDNAASAKAFSTADLSDHKVDMAGKRLWAISYDGSIRFPLLAWSPMPDVNNLSPPASITGGSQYNDRDYIEYLCSQVYPAFGQMFTYASFAGGDFDCIKDSSAPFCPPLANPKY